MTHLEVVKLVRDEVHRVGTIKSLAEKWHVTSAYVNHVLHYRCQPGPKILDRLGLEKVITIDYRRKEPR